jgi:hypothetical protein
VRSLRCNEAHPRGNLIQGADQDGRWSGIGVRRALRLHSPIADPERSNALASLPLDLVYAVLMQNPSVTLGTGSGEPNVFHQVARWQEKLKGQRVKAYPSEAEGLLEKAKAALQCFGRHIILLSQPDFRCYEPAISQGNFCTNSHYKSLWQKITIPFNLRRIIFPKKKESG